MISQGPFQSYDSRIEDKMGIFAYLCERKAHLWWENVQQIEYKQTALVLLGSVVCWIQYTCKPSFPPVSTCVCITAGRGASQACAKQCTLFMCITLSNKGTVGLPLMACPKVEDCAIVPEVMGSNLHDGWLRRGVTFFANSLPSSAHWMEGKGKLVGSFYPLSSLCWCFWKSIIYEIVFIFHTHSVCFPS